MNLTANLLLEINFIYLLILLNDLLIIFKVDIIIDINVIGLNLESIEIIIEINIIKIKLWHHYVHVLVSALTFLHQIIEESIVNKVNFLTSLL